MVRIDFRSREFVYNHHLSITPGTLIENEALSVNRPENFHDSNLIIQGDNLIALKSLIPFYSGGVDCVLIDPPYNTGKESWCYNDNVNSPMIQEWLSTTPIGLDDGLRHDKWCAMMWPRLRLLHQLLADDGILIMHIDENEHEKALMMLEEIFGKDVDNPDQSNVLGSIVWDKGNPKGDARGISYRHESIILVAKNATRTLASKPFRRLKPMARRMLNKAQTLWNKIGTNTVPDDLDALNNRYSLDLNLNNYSIDWTAQRVDQEYKTWVKENKNVLGSGLVPYKNISSEGQVYRPVHMGWPNNSEAPENYRYEINHPITGNACPSPQKGWRMPFETYQEMLGESDIVHEPSGHIRVGDLLFGSDETKQPERRYLLTENTYENIPSILEFGGSDGKFLNDIGIEFDYPKPHLFIADLIRYFTNTNDVILDSFAGSGTTGHATILANETDGGTRKFILVEMEDYAIQTTAGRLRTVIQGSEEAEALSSNFRFYSLGPRPDIEDILSGEILPTFNELGPLMFNLITGDTIQGECNPETFFVGENDERVVWMLYRDDLTWLRSPDAALTLSTAEELSRYNPDKNHVVISPARFVSTNVLNSNNLSIEYVPLPYTLFTVR
jgi:adenine-specific DNA-methyltransferase